MRAKPSLLPEDEDLFAFNGHNINPDGTLRSDVNGGSLGNSLQNTALANDAAAGDAGIFAGSGSCVCYPFACSFLIGLACFRVAARRGLCLCDRHFRVHFPVVGPP